MSTTDHFYFVAKDYDKIADRPPQQAKGVKAFIPKYAQVPAETSDLSTEAKTSPVASPLASPSDASSPVGAQKPFPRTHSESVIKPAQSRVVKSKHITDAGLLGTSLSSSSLYMPVNETFAHHRNSTGSMLTRGNNITPTSPPVLALRPNAANINADPFSLHAAPAPSAGQGAFLNAHNLNALYGTQAAAVMAPAFTPTPMSQAQAAQTADLMVRTWYKKEAVSSLTRAA